MATVSVVSGRVVMVALGVALLGGVGWVLTRNGPLAPVKVTVVEVAQGTVQPEVMGIGTVEARRPWQVGPTTAGRVLRVLVDVGDRVEAGQLLAEMDPVDLDARLAALDASVARAAAARHTAQAQVADATARLTLAEANWRRNQDLARQSFISAGALEGRQQELASAKAAVQSAQANVAGAEQDTSRLKAERLALAQQRGNVRLLAPGSGVVTARDAEPGTAVVAGQSVLRLVDPASLWVKVRFDQGRAADLATGQPARVVLRSRAQTPLPGRVARLELLADAVTEERLALVSLDGGMPEGVSVGEMAEVTVQLASPPPGLLLPNASLLREAGRTGVWRLTDGGLQWLGVSAVASGLNGQVLVQAQPPAAQSTDASGSTGSAHAPVAPAAPLPPGVAALAEGDRVVVHSQKVLRADMRVEVVKSLVPGGESAAGATAGSVGSAK